MTLRYAYNTNGLTSHRLDDALALLADSGYDGVALTLDHAVLDPARPDPLAEAERVRGRLATLGLGCVVETGARFLLDPRAKHEPTLVSPTAAGRARRLGFLRHCLQVAATLEAEAVSFWAGVDHARDPESWARLLDGVRAVVETADALGVVAALEPEPGMVVEDGAGFDRLRAEAAVPSLRLALDTGHCLVTGDLTPAEAVRAHVGDLGTVAIEDMRRGVHEHLAPGEGEMDFPAVLAALRDVGWRGLVCLELSRDSHRADTLVPAALAALRAAEATSGVAA